MSMQVLLAGAAGENCSASGTPASSKSYLVDVTPGADHDIVEEDMAFPRVVCWSFSSIIACLICSMVRWFPLDHVGTFLS